MQTRGKAKYFQRALQGQGTGATEVRTYDLEVQFEQTEVDASPATRGGPYSRLGAVKFGFARHLAAQSLIQ